MGRLTELRVRRAKPTDKDQWLNDGDGLYLRIRKGGSRTWVIRRKRLGKTEIITLGDALSLKEARLKAAEFQLRKDVSKKTVAELAKKYLKEVADKDHKRPELARGYMERAVIPELGRLKVRDVTRGELVAVIQNYAGERGKRTGDQLRSNMRALFGYAVELGYCESNPMLDVSRRVAGYKPVARDRVLSDTEIKAVWDSTHRNMPVIRFLMLTGLRISEAQKGHRKGDRWIVPAEFSKNGTTHWVYLTKQAAKQLPLPRCTATNIQGWIRRWCEKYRIEPRFTPHDLRRTVATRMADNDVQPFIVERVLNHTLQGVMGVYNRAEYEPERIEAAQTLERHILEVVGS